METMIDSIQDLNIFIQILDSGSMSAAARALNLSNAQISKRLKMLETQCGSRLIQRTTRALKATTEGELLAIHARRVLAEIAEAEAALSGRSEPAGRIHVAAPASFGQKYIAPVIFELMRKWPRLQVQLSLTDRFSDLIEEGIDLAIRIYRPQSGGEIARKLCGNERMLVASPEYVKAYGIPQHPEELAEHQCIALVSEREWHLVKDDRRISIKPTGTFSTSTGACLTAAAVAGLGVTLKSVWDIGEELEAGRLVQVLSDWQIDQELGIYAVYPENRQLPYRVRLLIDTLIEKWAPQPPWSR
jgi:DNA-binding transcriptional LysR family regulator